jgi:hypothetical protein
MSCTNINGIKLFSNCFVVDKLYILRLLAVLILIIVILASCVRNETPPYLLVESSLEELSEKGNMFVANNDLAYLLKGGKYQTSQKSRSGNYSAYSTPKNPFVLAIEFPNVFRDSYVEVTIWKQGENAHLVGVIEGSKRYNSVNNVVELDSMGWEKLNLKFYIPPLSDYSNLKIYVWNSGQDTVFYDDISIEIQRDKEFPEYTLPAFHLEMDTSDILSLMDTRKRAFKAGILQSKDEDWVGGFVFSNDKMMKSKLRLKGDWLDHLHGSKWSYRVKLKKDNTWNRMKVFSIQNPLSRLGVNEWFLHQLMISEGLLTTRYGFTPLTFNGRSKGLYAWEEHFVKQLPESQNRREGPLVRFVENALWDARVLDADEKMNYKKTPVFDVAVIKPFSSGKVVRDTGMYNQFLIAQNLMMQYRTRSKSATEIFDLEMMAKYFAMADVFLARHSLIWHNQRFYYNPVICKLEPIAYDCYSDIGLEKNIKNPITGYFNSGVTQPDEYIMVRELFNDTTFLNYYITSLEYFANVNYLDSVFQYYNTEVNYYDSLIKREYPDHKFYSQDILLNAERIRNTLPTFINQVAEMKSKDEKWENFSYVRNDYDTILPEFFASNLVIVYKEKVVGDSTILKVKNYFTEQLIILGVGKFNKKIREVIVPIPVLEKANNGKPVVETFKVSNNQVNYLFFSVEGSNKLYSVEINQWPEPTGAITPFQRLVDKYPFPDTSLIDKVVGGDIFIKSGRNIVDHPVLIPEGYVVHFRKGTIIDLINKASIISNSPVSMNGTKDSQIVITSSDFSSKGFVVMQAKTESIVDYVTFENLNTINYNGWIHTGAVTFYESDVTITNSRFYRNQCEDALNIIRSDFEVAKSTFEYIYGDAFDADFCTGNIISTSFINIGNDAMDFSGSTINISHSEVIGANDKGISGGEDSKLVIFDTKIRNANIGLASKDLSIVEVNNSHIESCNFGIVLLQKKPEFGPSVMVLKNTQILHSKTEMLIEVDSKVEIDGRIINGEEQNLSAKFY